MGRGLATEIGAEALVVAFGELGMRFRQEIVRPGLLPGVPGVQPEARFALYAIAPTSTRM